MSSDDDLHAMVTDAVKVGARGAAIGRNVFQHEDPALLAGRARKILDEM